jgi:hypothetical protein
MYEDWKFMWRWHEWELLDNQGVYSPPDSFGNWDRESFWFQFGTDEASKVEFVQWRGFRDCILCVARIEGRKSQLNLVKAVRNLPYKLVLIGKPAPNH